jgi:signal transduction histidine kinase
LPHSDHTAAALARRDFLKRFFHDLATPLSAVSLHLEGADRRIRKGADPAESLSIARTELGKAFDLFERGREFLLEDAGEAERIDFDALVRETARAHPGIQLEGQTGGFVRAARAHLAGALSALVVNGVEEAGADAVRIALERGNGRIRASVENPGKLGTDRPESLFSPKAARPGKTWGMGLSRALLAAGEAGGTVRLEQRDGRVIATLDLPEETA